LGLVVMDVMLYEVFEEEKEALKRYLPRNVKAEFSSNTVQTEQKKVPPASLISIRTQSVIPKEWGGQLNAVLTRSTGFDHLTAFQRSSKSSAKLGYLPTYCARAVAEHVLLMMLALLRKIKTQIRQFDIFCRDGITGKECLGRSILVVGVGHIGSEIANLARAVGMNVSGVDLEKKIGWLRYDPLEKAIPDSDIIICALPLTKETQNIFNYACLQNAKRGSLFINISRGEISPSADLKRLLDEGVLAGIGLDIYEGESMIADYLKTGKGKLTQGGEAILALKNDERVLFTPHNAFNTSEALERKAKQTADSITSFLDRGTFPNPIPLL
jgi:D-lactate dehydrogenase